jgi:uncharacterized protein with von Willebrand factor type A (vWA) domain
VAAHFQRTALALSHLVSTRFRSDALQIVAFAVMRGR